jgi:hypothetical protein
MASSKRSSDHNHDNNPRRSKTRRNVEPPRTTPDTERGLTHSPYFNGPLYERMSEDLHLGGMSKRTHEGYLRAVRQLADFCQRTPDQVSEDQLRRFFLHLKNDKAFASGSLRVAFSGVKFFYTRTCRRSWETLAQMRIKDVKSLPEVLTIEQVHQIIDTCTTQRMAVYFWVVYSLGLRMQDWSSPCAAWAKRPAKRCPPWPCFRALALKITCSPSPKSLPTCGRLPAPNWSRPPW